MFLVLHWSIAIPLHISHASDNYFLISHSVSTFSTPNNPLNWKLECLCTCNLTALNLPIFPLHHYWRICHYLIVITRTLLIISEFENLFRKKIHFYCNPGTFMLKLRGVKKRLELLVQCSEESKCIWTMLICAKKDAYLIWSKSSLYPLFIPNHLGHSYFLKDRFPRYGYHLEWKKIWLASAVYWV